MRRARGERGQILAVVALALVALLGVCAFAIDVGYAYYAKRQLQSATDAAALAGAQDLPVAATAIAIEKHAVGRERFRIPRAQHVKQRLAQPVRRWTNLGSRQRPQIPSTIFPRNHSHGFKCGAGASARVGSTCPLAPALSCRPVRHRRSARHLISR